MYGLMFNIYRCLYFVGRSLSSVDMINTNAVAIMTTAKSNLLLLFRCYEIELRYLFELGT